MNGSTSNGVVGFNVENARRTADSLNASFNAFYDLIDGAMFTLAGLIFTDGDFGGRGVGGPVAKSYGWYAPEAVQFDDNVFTPKRLELINNMHKLYVDVYEKVENSIIKWAQTTGVENVSITRFTRTVMKGQGTLHPDAKNSDANGNVRISPDLAELIASKKREIMNSYSERGTEIVDFLRGTESFIGAGQQSTLISNISKMLDVVEKEIIAVYDQAIKGVNASIQKYTSIAKQVAGSFGGSPTSSASGSTSNSFNTII